MAIAVLGPLSVGGDGDGLAPRDRVVLAALALCPGEVVSAERLADAMWGERPPASWRKVVQGCVVRLRKELGSAAIATTGQGYRLAVPTDEVDARRFERLVGRAREALALGEPERAEHVASEALALWRGRALVELEGWDQGRIEAERLEELRLEAEELRVDAALRAGRHGEVLAQAHARVAAAPLRERRWALLALAEYRAGRQGEALRTLHRARTVLATQLGLEPGPDLVALEEAILRQDPSLVAADALPEASVTCPYLGLVPYDVGDADGFFGRDADVAACLGRLATAGVLAVVGPSGSGKSSLVRAGVAAALGRDGRRVVVITPGTHPTDALTALPDSGPAPVLVVDQCEEALATCEDTGEQARFFAALAGHAYRGPLVVAVRADRLGELSAYPGFVRLIEPGLYLLSAMADADLRMAIEGPAHQAGLLLEPGLVELLVREVEREPGALPLLSHALRMTWTRREGRTLTVEGYRDTGGIRGAVAQSAEELYEQVPADQRPLLRDLLLRLVASGPDGGAVRRRVPRRIVATDPARERLIERLVVARLVTCDDGVVELAHEALARAWPRLRDWLDDDVAGQRILRHVTQAADTWDAMGRPDGELYRGPRLAQALDWRERTQPDLTPTERAFVEASQVLADAEQQAAQSRARHQARQNRRLRALLAGVGVLLVAALVAGLVAVRQRDRAQESVDQAREADAVQLGAQALVEEDLALSLLLARQAVAIDDTSQTRSYLLAALLRAPAAVGIMHGHRNSDLNPYRLGGSAVSPDGKTLAVAAPGGWLDFFDTRTYQQLGEPLRVPGGVGPIAYSPDGQTLAFGKGANIRLIDAHTREQLAEMRTDANAAIRLAFTKDGSQLAVLESEGEGGSAWITIRDAATLRPIGSPIQPDGFAGSWISGLWTDPTMALTPDGRSLVTTSAEGELAWWDLQSRLKTRTLRIEEGYRALALSPDGLTAAIGLEDGIQLIDVRTGAVQEARGALASTPIWLLFSPDGNTVVSTSRDATMTLWDAGSVTPRETWRGHLDSVQQPVFSPDGETLYTTGHDGTAIAWDISRERRLGRPFTFTHDQGLLYRRGTQGD